MTKHKRIINKRPVCIFAILMAVGIITGELIFGADARFRFIPLVIGVICLIVFLSVSKVRKLAYIPIAFLVGFVGICASCDVYSSYSIDGQSGEFSARIASEITVDNGETQFQIDQIYIGDRKLKYKAKVYVAHEFEPDFNLGDVVKISGSIKSIKHERFSSYYASTRANGFGYSISAFEVSKAGEGSAPFIMRLRHRIKRYLFENLDGYSASVCQALILGDKSGIDENAYANISSSGLAHVLAVSGLHITTLSAALYFVLKKLKINPKIACAIVILITFLYTATCAFTASALRAFIMSSVFAIASLAGRKRDRLSILALSAVFILLFRPTALFEAGFLLSYSSVSGIILFFKPLNALGMKAVEKLSPKRRIGTRFVKACAVSLSANIVSLPFVAYFFEAVPTLFLLSSIVVLPYVMALYIVILVLMLLSLITTFGGFLLPAQYLLIPFRLYVGGVGNLSFATIPSACGAIGVIALCLIFLLCSRFVFLTKRQKTIGSMSVASVFFVIASVFYAL